MSHTIENAMNGDCIQGNLRQIKGKTQELWGKLMHSESVVHDGRKEIQAGQIQERYGQAVLEAEKRQASKLREQSGSWFNFKK
jgi:uncharacterized protein YjbJ (UPF0337 family)